MCYTYAMWGGYLFSDEQIHHYLDFAEYNIAMTNLQPKNRGKDGQYALNNPHTTNRINTNNNKEMNVGSQIYPANRMERSQPNTRDRLLYMQKGGNGKQPNIIVVQHDYPQEKMGYRRQPVTEVQPKNRVFEKGLSKVLYMRLVRNLSQLKTNNLELFDLVKKQERYFREQKESWQAQLLALSFKMEEMEYLRQMSHQNQLNELQQAVKLRDQLIAQLNKMISNLKNQPLAEETEQQHPTSQTCASCQLLEIKLNSVKEEAMNMAKKQTKLKEEYQILQQRVFDLEQQVVGIDLEVENRLKEALQSLPQLSSYNQTSQQIIDSMNRQNQMLRVKCQKLERYLRDQQILKTKEEQLRIMQKEYQLKNQALLQAIARNENVIQLSYEREHHLLLAEQNLSKKIEELRMKEAQLSQWENHLTKDQNNIKNTHLQHPRETFGKQRVAREEEETSLKSFGNQPQDYDFTHSKNYTLEPSNNIVENIQGQVHIPMLPLNRHQQYNEHDSSELYSASQVKYNLNHQKSRKSLGRNNEKSITESAYAYRSPYLIEKSKHTASNHNLQIKSPAQRQNTYVQPSIQGSRIISMGNRSVSRQSQSPSIRARNTPNNNPKYSGLQSKLDRLRVELRKQIESIK